MNPYRLPTLKPGRFDEPIALQRAARGVRFGIAVSLAMSLAQMFPGPDAGLWIRAAECTCVHLTHEELHGCGPSLYAASSAAAACMPPESEAPFHVR